MLKAAIARVTRESLAAPGLMFSLRVALRSKSWPDTSNGMSEAVSPFPKQFPEKLASYCEQINEAIRGNKHHDTRRHLFLNFLREAFKIDPLEVELESKITAGELRDASTRFTGTSSSR